MKVLIVGATGMLGYSLFTNLCDHPDYQVFGTVRSISDKKIYFETYLDNIFTNIDINDLSALESVIEKVNPNVVINCVGLIKQYEISKQHIAAIEINALLPHRLVTLCDKYDAKLIHFSTDCVFNGQAGMYKEVDVPNATDLYGKSKCLGEVSYGKHLTLRTSIIGHELTSKVSLVDWFLDQKIKVNGFSKAVFSGLPTCYIAKMLVEKILPRDDLNGLYHLSVEPIDKYKLLSLIADEYEKDIKIEESDQLILDRSLDSTRLRKKIDFIPPTWNELVQYMHKDYINRYSS